MRRRRTGPGTRLLTHPCEARTALALVAGGDPAPVEPSWHALLDEPAQTAYVEHARALAEELAEAEGDNDLERATKLRAELDTLVDHLVEATGLAGRTRTFVGPTERARTSVRKAIMRAIDQIAAADTDIAHHLRVTITTGYTCTYTGDPADRCDGPPAAEPSEGEGAGGARSRRLVRAAPCLWVVGRRQFVPGEG